jgi:hypothetical protein
VRGFLAIGLAFAAVSAWGQIYRWVDDKGAVHYSNETPPPGANAAKVDSAAEPRAPVEQRLGTREQIEARLAAERASVTPRAPKGLDFTKYASIARGMSEGELIGIAGEPDLTLWDWRSVKSYIYYPTPADPFTTTITLVDGRVNEIERGRRF